MRATINLSSNLSSRLGKMIGIVASHRDLHAKRVGQELSSMGIEYEIIDWQNSPLVTLNPLNGVAILELRDRSIRSSDFSAIWQRRIRRGPNEGTQPDVSEYCLAEWRTIVKDVFDPNICVSSIEAQTAATKPLQLSIANKVGLPLPETIISNDPDEVLEFVSDFKGSVICKAMNAPRNKFLATTQWRDRFKQILKQSLPISPVIFQKLIIGNDIRCTYINGELYAIESFTTQFTDGRLSIDAPCKTISFDPELEQKICQLMQHLNLKFGTIDLIRDGDGSIVFLEVNPQGQFLHQEITSGQPLCEAMAKMLSRLGK